MRNQYILEVKINGEGSKLAIISPLCVGGGTDGGYRIAGPKEWGGSNSIAELKIEESALIGFIKGHAPELIPKLLPEAPAAKPTSPTALAREILDFFGYTEWEVKISEASPGLCLKGVILLSSESAKSPAWVIHEIAHIKRRGHDAHWGDWYTSLLRQWEVRTL